MRIPHPLCGLRDLREFTYRGAALTDRPSGDWSDDWDEFLHLRDNPAGPTEELWYHGPTGTWIIVERNTVTHEITGSRMATGGSP